MTKLYDEINYLPGPILYKPIPQIPDAGVVAELVEAARGVLAQGDAMLLPDDEHYARLRSALALIAHNTTEG